MTAPKRIQLSRRKGWRKPENTVVVSRPSRWGNPFRIVPVSARGPFDVWFGDCYVAQSTDESRAREIAVERFRKHLLVFNVGDDDLEPLRGKNLACWCSLDQPCHADVLIELANGEAS